MKLWKNTPGKESERVGKDSMVYFLGGKFGSEEKLAHYHVSGPAEEGQELKISVSIFLGWAE